MTEKNYVPNYKLPKSFVLVSTDENPLWINYFVLSQNKWGKIPRSHGGY